MVVGWQSKDIKGNGSLQHVAAANSTANIVGDLILPLCLWLGVEFVLEQPAIWSAVCAIFACSVGSCLFSLAKCFFSILPQAGSILCDWPSIHSLFASLPGNEGQVSAVENVHYTIRISMLFFGGFSSKPLLLRGTWRGLKLLDYLSGKLALLLRARAPFQLTTQRGRWRIAECGMCDRFLSLHNVKGPKNARAILIECN